MDLDRITVALRQRGPWEAMDLGFALGRTWFKTLAGLWILAALPIALLALLPAGGQADWWAMLFWWFKPLYEAPMVWWVSRALFGERPPLGAARGLFAAAWTRRLLPYLLWRRLSPRRSLYLPVVLLEGQRGAALGARRRLLGEGAGGAWLTLILVHFEYILWGGALLLLYFLTLGNPILEGVAEGSSPIDLEAALTDPGSWAYWLSALLFLTAEAVLAPFYVCGGFALYVARRTELEAWDLELAFRRVGTRRGRVGLSAAHPRGRRAAAPVRRGVAGGLLGLVVLGLLLAAAPGPPAAAAPDPGPTRPGAPAAVLPEPAAARSLIAQVLADRDFGSSREQTAWVYAGPEGRPADPGWLGALGDLGAGLGQVLRVLLVLAAVTVLALLVARILRDWQPPGWRRTRRAPVVAPLRVAGLAADPGGDALAAAVRARLATGDARGALALLYRGGLAELARRGVRVPDAATEGECLRLAASRLGAAERAPFEHLTRDWQALAYAGVAPDPERIAARLADWLAWRARAAPQGAAGAARGPAS